jgi:hypothetical protein
VISRSGGTVLVLVREGTRKGIEDDDEDDDATRTRTTTRTMHGHAEMTALAEKHAEPGVPAYRR